MQIYEKKVMVNSYRDCWEHLLKYCKQARIECNSTEGRNAYTDIIREIERTELELWRV